MFKDNSMSFLSRLLIKRKGSAMFALTLVLICILCASVGQIILKSGMSQVGEINSVRHLFNFNTLFHVFTNPRVLLGILCYAAIAVLWLGALSTLNVSFVYPLMSLAYVITALIAFVFLREHIAPLHWLGIILVVGGCFLITRTG
ncbi:MAG: hypothetical protein CL874_03035 [Dehalococcoidales bacterium]|jgi:drug/metabolite transporter (DMT)-like permease|nr:hypothetical protein [Dehalococcoidales bacterium]|tara:strand:+ start:229 stop:663 length:435 start_codon:yes stop_codon:yes gene_type:complete